jgi:excisionase family DNA binding protein
VSELARERVTVQQAAASLGITESTVRKRIRKGDIRSEKVLEGNRERLYVFLDQDAALFPEPFREKYMRSLEDRVKTLEDEVMRQQAIILSMSQSLRALTGAPEAPQGVEEAQEEAEPRPSAGGERETPRPPATSAPATSRLGMAAWALAVGGIATLLASFYAGSSFLSVLLLGQFASPLSLILLALVPLVTGLWAGSTKRPSLPWFSSPHRWFRRGGRSILEISMFASGVPAWFGWVIVLIATGADPSSAVVAVAALFAFALALPAFMSGAFLGNALRRVGLLGTPKEPLQGEEEGEYEEEVWTPRKEARWGLAGSIIVAFISAVASVVAAALSQ